MIIKITTTTVSHFIVSHSLIWIVAWRIRAYHCDLEPSLGLTLRREDSIRHASQLYTPGVALQHLQ